MHSRFESIPIKEREKRRYESSEDTQCGLGGCKPEWLQRFADPKVYLILYCVLGILQGAYFTYFIGVISTLEKRFAFESTISGIIMIADNISPIFTSVLVGYFGGQAHKPRLIAGGMLMVVLSCFLSALPYFVGEPAWHLLQDDSQVIGGKKKQVEFCESDFRNEDCQSPKRNSSILAISILFIGNFLNGFGYTAFYTIGATYLDDNVKKKNSPVYFSAMSGLRIFGPALGFLLSSFCLKYYENPFHDPGISQLNPRWIGAWWMGFIILGCALLVFTAILVLFPRNLPERFRSEKKSTKDSEEEKLPKLKDFPRAVRRLLKNPILVCHIISVTFQVNGFAGYFVFMPKYMESQYQQSASSASLFSGATGIIAMLTGILIGGFIIKAYKPRPRYLTGYMVIVEICSVVGLLVSIFLGCPQVNMPGTKLQENGTLNLYNECNFNCHCTRRIFEPVCDVGNDALYFSPCYAGCSNSSIYPILMNSINSTVKAATKKVFDNCQCITDTNSTFIPSQVSQELCPSTCNMFITYILMLCISKFVSSTARVGNTLITFRCVDAKDKSFALGTFGSVIAAFAFIPYPLIYGALVDSTCLVWEETCSKTGNCWLYDREKFRNYLHGMSMILITIGICFDGVVFLLSDRLTNFYGEEDEVDSTKKMNHWTKEDDDDDDIIFSKKAQATPMTEINAIM